MLDSLTNTEALRIDRVVYGEAHLTVATDFENLGDVHRHFGDAKKAIESYKAAHKIGKKIYGEKHYKVAMYLNKIGIFWK